MIKYKCECKSAKCEVEREDTFFPQYCTCFCAKKAYWQEVKAEKLPSWCKVGKVVYHKESNKFFKIATYNEEAKLIELEDNGWFYLDELAEARLRPFNESEMRELVGKKITYKTSKEVFLVTYFNKVHVGLGHLCLTAEELFKDYTMADGSPCGVYEHLENGEWVK